MGHPERSDAELLAAHVAGDRHAFQELYGRHQRRLRRLARLTTGCPEDAEDALQEAMLSAHRSAGSFRYNAAVGSWLHRIVVNACRDRLRRNRLHPSVPLAESPAVADRTAEVETALEVRAALRRLPTEQRAAVVTVDMHGYSIADAARALGVAQGTVKSRCARGRARLAVLLGRDHTGPAARVRPAARRIALAAEGVLHGRVDDCA
ncbi:MULTISPECIES: RNA polymerase sigma factor SigM [Mycobacteriaceae]|uniref:Alternative RNA polymerase sigma factor SigM n=3 Tax=Mycobacteriaceae TaxID=1762 RepID=F5YVS8_MYCSD|nr:MULTISPECIES: RNA polymerase sigma factor SigM [Mycobacteriaceae]AEF38335.1 alternative RNA polymerase sigma factor SigM [Mycolicibacter sinensis]BBX12755.1 ECF RNA polymerase sigma factor SigM [Mycobacterium novum]